MNFDDLKLRIYLAGKDFLLPYIERELPGAEFVDTDADAAVAILSPDEDLPACFDPESTAVLVCPNIVGTGMTGLPWKLVEKIARGTYCHVPGSEARLSTIHAVDVARAVRLTLGKPGRYVCTDCADPTFHDFTEALAWRIKQIRITAPMKNLHARIMLGSFYKVVTTDDLHNGRKFAEEFNFSPTPVTEYLRTHDYDDESL